VYIYIFIFIYTYIILFYFFKECRNMPHFELNHEFSREHCLVFFGLFLVHFLLGKKNNFQSSNTTL